MNALVLLANMVVHAGMVSTSSLVSVLRAILVHFAKLVSLVRVSYSVNVFTLCLLLGPDTN